MKPHLIPIIAWLAASVSCLHAEILVQELFDGISAGDASLGGAGDTATSIGMTGTWVTYGNSGIFTADNFNVDGADLPGLPSNDGVNGGVWNNTASWDTGIYATRPLETPIDFNTDREIFFSVRLNNVGDTAMGIGLASGEALEDEFIGAGFSWNNARSIATGQNEAGNAAYISHGTLSNTTATVNGIAGVIVDGVYSIQAFEPAGSVNGYGLLVGRLIIRATGDDVIAIKRYEENETIDNDLGAISWTATSTVDSAMTATHLLLWMNGMNGSGELDAIRIGETWTDVTGVELAGSGQPTLVGASVSGATGTAAQASVNLFTIAAEVTLYWDIIDQGTGAWAHSNALGARAIGPVSGALTGLSPDTRYFYRFHAVNTAATPAQHAWSEAGRSFVTVPAGKAVTNLAAEPYSAFEAGLTWTDVFATETGYLIQRSPAGAGTWVTVGTAQADEEFYLDSHSGLTASTAYDYRIFATNEAGNSDPSNIASVTTEAGSPLETQLLIHFNGSFDGVDYTLDAGETDATGTFRANGAPTIDGGFAIINPGNEGGTDGFAIDPSVLGDLRALNWVAEALVTYESTGTGTTPVVMDVQGDCNLRLRAEDNDDVLQLFYWNGSAARQQFTALPPAGEPVHLAFAWDAGSATLTGYVNGVPFGSVSGGPFATPDVTTLTFGYFGRANFVGRGIDGILDAIAFQTGSASFNPASDFLILPGERNYASWIGGFPVGGLTGFDDDADADGLPNGIEAFLGTNPAAPNGSGLTQVSTNGTVTTFTHPQASPPLSDVSGSYEWSLDLVSWYAGNGVAGPDGGPTVNIPHAAQAAGVATVTATASAPLDRIFLRIVATPSPR